MSWILTKKLDLFAGPGAIKRREVVLGVKVGLLLLQLSPISGATDIVTLFRTAVGTATAKYTSCCVMPSGHCLNIFVILAAVHGILGLPGWRLSRVFTLCPSPLVPVPNRPPRLFGR